MNCASLDGLRSVLIFAGQIEQAVSDRERKTAADAELEAVAIQLTDNLARFFCQRFLASDEFEGKAILLAALERMARIIERHPQLGEESGAVKIPEGYAFYALFPEQYCVTALDWARQRSKQSEALVVGLRSIGTSLSAVVKETLCQIGWRASRFTVRPGGHPFRRQLSLDVVPKGRDIPILIVDEGPGLSGSSMAAVAEAFLSAGCSDISFLPGHGNEPGALSPSVQEVWRRVPRYVTPLQNVSWKGLSLERCLLEAAEELCGGVCERIEDISGGQWQKLVRTDGVKPISPPQFERMKFLCTMRNGQSVLWKFAGLHGGTDGCTASQTTLARLSGIADAGYTPRPLGVSHGFVATSWLQGERLSRSDAKDPSLLTRIGNYIVDAARPPLAFTENQIAVERMAEMLYCNAKESLGEDFAEKLLALKEGAVEAEAEFPYGAGLLAPHDWRRTAYGTVFKVDAEGHFADHTLIGEQSVLWDIAGARVEWDLDARACDVLLEAIESRGMRVDPGALAFYLAAYSAFRVGLLSMGILQTPEERQKDCIAKTRAFYVQKLADVLKGEVLIAQSAH